MIFPINKILNAFSVDVEDYFQVSAFEHLVDRSDWSNYPVRVGQSTRCILDLLDRHGVKATFFVLGWIAEHYPELVQDIHARGHEIGSHGYWHRLIYEQSPDDFRADIRRSQNVLSDITGEPVTLYRAPSFSITRASQWALEILAEEGFHIDSSIFPIVHDRYGMLGAERHLHQIPTPAGTLWEFPPAVLPIPRFPLPVGGGGYFRLFPLPLTSACLRRLNRREQQPFVFYIYPWELDPGQPRMAGASSLAYFRHSVNIRKTQSKLDRLLGAFRFGIISEVVEQAQNHPRSSEQASTAQSSLLTADCSRRAGTDR